MTLKELSQLYYLNREIEMDQRRLRELEAKALPGGPGHHGNASRHRRGGQGG